MPVREEGRGAAFEDGPPQTLGEEADGEQLKLILPPDDGMSLGEWMEWMPKDTQYRSRWTAA